MNVPNIKNDKKLIWLWTTIGTVSAGILIYFITGMVSFYNDVGRRLPVITTKLNYLQQELTVIKRELNKGERVTEDDLDELQTDVAVIKNFADKGERFTRNDGLMLRKELMEYVDKSLRDHKNKIQRIIPQLTQ